MLSEEKNRLLTQTGKGTPMGELLRRYWMPIAGTAEFDEQPIKPVRLMGEDLVLYKDLDGNYGLIERQCAHRRADMAYGVVEKNGLRCTYHGWQFDARGACTEMPFEDEVHASRDGKGPDPKAGIAMAAYPVAVKAGMVWAYLGPQPVPLLPDWEAFNRKHSFAQVIISEIPCNWLQCQENSIDPVHFEWMHDYWTHRQKGGDPAVRPDRHKRLEFEEFEYGFVYKRLRGDMDESSPFWTVGRVCLWPNIFYLGGHFEYRVPIDDENTLSVTIAVTRVPKESEPYVQEKIPTWHSPIRDERTGRWIDSHIINQDVIGWVGQGRITDRSRENLRSSDRGIVMVRNRFLADLERIARGEDPKGVIRDPAHNRNVVLPAIELQQHIEGPTLKEVRESPRWRGRLGDFPWAYGQPKSVSDDFVAAMGIDLRSKVPPA